MSLTGPALVCQRIMLHHDALYQVHTGPYAITSLTFLLKVHDDCCMNRAAIHSQLSVF